MPLISIHKSSSVTDIIRQKRTQIQCKLTYILFCCPHSGNVIETAITATSPQNVGKSKQPPVNSDSMDNYVSTYICVCSLLLRRRVACGLQNNKGGEQLRISRVACDCGVNRSSSPSDEQSESRGVIFMEGGSIWGRTGCLFNSQGLGGCNSGDCGGNLQCKVESQDNIAITKAEFEFLGGIAKPDTFSVTLEKGYNLPMSVVPSYTANNVSSRRPCESMACTADASTVCPKKLQMKKKGSVVTACNGHYDGYLPSSPAFSQAFQKACPRAFPFRSGTICPPSTASYTVTFCPRRRSL